MDITKIRNIGIIAHIDAGKTTTTERLLFYTGKTYKIGEVDEGTAVMDWMDQEKERGITIFAAATTCYWKEYKINIIDTPGHVDFTVEVERALRVLDGAITIFCGVGGVQPQSETVWRQSSRYNIPRLVYINKMDRTGADFYRVVKEIHKKLQSVPLILHLPVFSGDEFQGIIDIVKGRAIFYTSEDERNAVEREIPDSMKEEATNYRNILIEKLADVDEKIMKKYLEGEEIKIYEIKDAIRKGTLECKYFPVFCGTSLRNKGALLLLDAIVDYLPSPADRGKIEGVNPLTGERIKLVPSEEEKFSMYAFKVYNDQHKGRLVYTRIYSGILKRGHSVYNWTRNCKERIMKIFEVHADRYYEKEETNAGDIVAIAGLKQSYTGDTIADKNCPVIFENLKFPEPVIYVSIEPKVQSEQDKVYSTLLKIAEEDPTIKVKIDEETGQIILMGIGELQIEVIAERLRRGYNLNIRVGKPEVAYRETITVVAKGEGKFIKKGTEREKGHYGHVVLSVEPLSRGKKFVFENFVDDSKIPAQFIHSIEEGVYEAMECGVLLGVPVVDIKVIVIDGSFHPVDSNEIAYRIAASMAFADACRKAAPVLLEPIMKIEIAVPEEFLGEVLADLNLRNGRIEQIDTQSGFKIVDGYVPLRTVFGYATVLRSLTQGRGNYIIEPSYYEIVPETEMKKITGK
ncbi:MAG: elongation factor G [Candidatus Ratteibacteria bacterium]|nr:elongation factor G [Candidatus Ratteibacteria bacterium]